MNGQTMKQKEKESDKNQQNSTLWKKNTLLILTRMNDVCITDKPQQNKLQIYLSHKTHTNLLKCLCLEHEFWP